MREELSCPLGHTCDKCLWSVHLLGTSPQTGEPVNTAKCAIVWLPELLILTARETRQVGAAVDCSRNEMFDGLRTIASQQQCLPNG